MGQVARKVRAPARRRPRESRAQQLNARVMSIQDWAKRIAPMFETAPAIDMGGDDVAARERLEMLAHYADQFSRALYRLDRRGWGPKAATGRDPRLPEIGATLARSYRGKTHTVTITAGGFEYRGKIHPSLSAVGRLITRASTNGFKFFGLCP